MAWTSRPCSKVLDELKVADIDDWVRQVSAIVYQSPDRGRAHLDDRPPLQECSDTRTNLRNATASGCRRPRPGISSYGSRNCALARSSQLLERVGVG
jgi:hypothetical protein